jgi:glutamate racemase
MNKLAILDSGIGGMSFLPDFTEFQLELLYSCDLVNVPYGSKDTQFIFERMIQMTEALLQKGVFNILIACNTATTQIIQNLRTTFPMVRFFGVEPYVNILNHLNNPQNSYTLILTPGTFKSERFKILLEKFDSKQQIIVRPLENLAKIIEDYQNTMFKENIIKEIGEIKTTHLILGCTHYSLIGKFLADFYSAQIIDPKLKIVSYVVDQLKLEKRTTAVKFILKSTDCGKSYQRFDLKDFFDLNG